MDVEDIVSDKKKKPSTLSELIKIGFMLLFIYGCVKFILFMWSLDTGTRSSFDAGPSCGGGSSMAQIMARNFVKRDLKAPSTASFTGSRVETGKDCTFRVSGAVDAQNSFGAMLRTEYSVTLQYNAATKKWTRLR